MLLGRKVRQSIHVFRHPQHLKSPVFRNNDAPRYVRAFIAHIVVYGIQLATIVFLRIRLMRLNALKRQAQMDTSIKTSGKNLVCTYKVRIRPWSIDPCTHRTRTFPINTHSTI